MNVENVKNMVSRKQLQRFHSVFAIIISIILSIIKNMYPGNYIIMIKIKLVPETAVAVELHFL